MLNVFIFLKSCSSTKQSMKRLLDKRILRFKIYKGLYKNCFVVRFQLHIDPTTMKNLNSICVLGTN